MDLSIVIVNWNTRQLLLDCLQSVSGSLEGSGCEVVVVDNGSTDGSAQAALDAFPSIRMIQNEKNAGFARANNQAIRASQGRNILLLNSDARLTPQAVPLMLQLFARNPQVGIAGPQLLYPDGSLQLSHSPLPTLKSEALSLFGVDKKLPLASPGSEPHETGTVSGACLLVRRKVLDQIGLLDEGFFMFSEEVDLCLRAQQAGWKVYHLPSARVIHLGGGSTASSTVRLLTLYEAKQRYFAKHYGAAAGQRLLRLMRLAAWSKMWAYSLAGRAGRAAGKPDFWRAVLNGLADMNGRERAEA